MKKRFYFSGLLLGILLLCQQKIYAQAPVTLTTTSSSPAWWSASSSCIVFGVGNTNSYDIVITDLSNYMPASHSTSYSLWYHPTVLTGVPSAITTANGWIEIIPTQPPVPVSGAAGIYPVFSNMNFIIPANTTYRLALVATANGPWYGASGSAPNLFSAGGVEIYAQTNPISPTYVGYFPGPPNNTPRNFLGSITFKQAVPFCNGKPDAGTAIANTEYTCPGYPVRVVDTNHSKDNQNAQGFTWVWETSLDSVIWQEVTGTNGKDTLDAVVNIQTYYRLKVICKHSADTSYSNVINFKLAPPYACYCFSKSDGGVTDTSDIGAFRIGPFTVNDGGPHTQNPVAIKEWTNRFSEGIINLYIDSTYEFSLYHTMPSNIHADGKVTIFMDFNKNLQYDIPEERVYSGKTSVTNFYLIDTIHIPAQAILGEPVGMRVIINNDVAPNIPSDEACGTYTSGETEDYVVQFSKAFPVTAGNIKGVKDFTIYPSPTSGQITIKIEGLNAEEVQVNIINITGQKVYAQTYRNNQNAFIQHIDLTGQAAGVYLVEVIAGGQKMLQRMVLK